MSFDLSNYVDVPARIAEFRKAHPEGTLQSEILPSPIDGFVVVKGYAYRSPDDPRPGVGLAWEPVPGKTPYTKDSELQNAETSAWGRAIIAVGAADASKGVASANEVRNRRGEESVSPPPSSYVAAGKCPSCGSDVWDNTADHAADSRKPAWKCKNKDCQGGSPKKNGSGNWGWASWDEDPWGGTPVREDYEPVPFEYEPPDDPEAPF